jgi:hypothetical protein
VSNALAESVTANLVIEASSSNLLVLLVVAAAGLGLVIVALGTKRRSPSGLR